MTFNIGDKVRITNGDNAGLTRVIACVDRDDVCDSVYPYGINLDQPAKHIFAKEKDWSSGNSDIADNTHLELITSTAKTTKFKVGDRVRCIKSYNTVKVGDTGTICCDYRTEYGSGIPWGVKFDRRVSDGHTCNEHCEDGYGYYVYDDNIELTPSTEPQKEVRKVIVKVPTQEDWDAVVKQAIKDGYSMKNWNCWSVNGKRSAINMSEDWGFASLQFYKDSSSYIDYEFLTTQEYLNKFNASISEPQKEGGKRTKIMEIIKNIFKTKEQKALSHFGLTNGDGGLTMKGREEFLDYLWATGKEVRIDFIRKIVEQYEEDIKKK